MNTTSPLIFISALFLSSCAFDDYDATSKTGNRVHERYYSMGGTGSIKRGDGSSLVHDHQTSFQQAMAAGGVALGAWIGYLTQQSNNLLAQMQNANLTKQQISALNFQYLTTKAQLDAATAQAKIAAGQ